MDLARVRAERPDRRGSFPVGFLSVGVWGSSYVPGIAPSSSNPKRQGSQGRRWQAGDGWGCDQRCLAELGELPELDLLISWTHGR